MKIFIINKTIGFGSVGKIVEDLYSAIVTTGNDCKIAYAIKNNKTKVPNCNTIRIGSFYDRFIHAFLSLFFGRTAFYSKLATKKLINDIKKYNPDLVHIHGVYGYYLNMDLLFKALSEMNVKVVSTLHSCWDFTGHCCYFDYIGCNKWQSICDKCPQKSSYPKSIFDNTKKNFILKRSLYNKITDCTIVTPSDWLKQLVSKSFLMHHTINTIYNGINLSIFKNSVIDNKVLIKYGLSFNKPTIICVANKWEKRKGLSDIIEMAKIANEMQIIIVGLNDKQMKSLPHNIIGIKKTTDMVELSMLYSFATVLFNPTYEDNYPTVNLEAIACHTPVVAYDTGGCKETIKGGKFGCIINKKDYMALFSYINKLYTKEYQIDFSDLSYLDANTMSKKYLNLYKKLIG